MVNKKERSLTYITICWGNEHLSCWMRYEVWKFPVNLNSEHYCLRAKTDFKLNLAFFFFLFRKGIYRRRENNPLINYKPWLLRIPDVILDQTRMALCWRKNAVKTFLWVDFMLSRSILFSDWWIHACQKLWWQTS